MSEKEQKEKEVLSQKYHSKGFQALSLAEYEAIRARKNRKNNLKIPPFLKFIAATPVIIIFIFGLLFVPWIIFMIATGPYQHWKEKDESKSSSYDTLYAKKGSSSHAKN